MALNRRTAKTNSNIADIIWGYFMIFSMEGINTIFFERLFLVRKIVFMSSVFLTIKKPQVRVGITWGYLTL